MGVKFGIHAKFHPHRCNVSPLRGEKPQNWPLSKLNTGRFVLREMLPVKITNSSQTQANNRQTDTRLTASLQTSNQASTSSLNFYRPDALPDV